MWTKYFSFLFLIILLNSCSKPNQNASGSATETTNGISISILSRGGDPAISAHGILCPLDYTQRDSSQTCIHTLADSTGFIYFDIQTQGQWMLEVKDSTGSLWTQIQLDTLTPFVNLGTANLKSFSRIHGITTSEIPPGTPVWIVGSEHQTFVDSMGRFAFDSLPAGSHIIEYAFLQDTYRSYASVGPGSSITTSQAAIESAENLLFDDFEDGDSRHRYAPLSGEGWWYISSRSGVQIIPAEKPIPIDTTDPLFHNSIHFRVEVDSGIKYPWANCGVQLGIQGESYDLNHVDTISFWAKGTGRIQFAISITQNGSLNADVDLDTIWTRYAIPLDTLPIPLEKERDALLKQSNSLVWQFSDTGELWLDQLSFHGSSREFIWGR